ncbi:MAG: hypothetical protein WBX11_02620 [Thiobacillaceae bacterium]|jgi:hypothetical protein
MPPAVWHGKKWLAAVMNFPPQAKDERMNSGQPHTGYCTFLGVKQQSKPLVSHREHGTTNNGEKHGKYI